jgi:hypothetical protein
MSNILKTGLAYLNKQRNAHMTDSVTYRRGGSVMVDGLAATPGKTVFRLDSGYGVSVRKDMRDFLINTEDLILNGVVVEPEKRDEIIHDGIIYEVSSPGNDEPAWRYSDAYNQTLRIHTKNMGIAE